jgi:hypothetical protein
VNRRRDEGAVLPLVLVMMVVTAMVIIPLLSYAVTVLRANTVVSSKTRNAEAAEAGLRLALLDPQGLFNSCATPAPEQIVNGITTTVECQRTAEVGPNEALGFVIPTALTATQLNAGIPAAFAGTRAGTGTNPIAERQWLDLVTALDEAALPTAAQADQIWLPELPARPSESRSGSFTMPSAYNCTVYLPGYYAGEVDVTGGNVYFASGVYYFEKSVTFGGNADVVVGSGLAVLENAEDCSDDYQVAENVENRPPRLRIDGNGATFVFGDEGSLTVTDEATVTFNPRYTSSGAGARVSIMSVNGSVVGGSVVDHDIPGVAFVPRSNVVDVSGSTNRLIAVGTANQPAAAYKPSSPTFTAQPVAPDAITEIAVEELDGALLVTWDDVTGEAAGGALPDYVVTATRRSGGAAIACDSSAIYVIETDPHTHLSCVIGGLDNDVQYDVTVAARNAFGQSTGNPTVNEEPDDDAAIVPPGQPTVTAKRVMPDGSVRLRWDAPDDDGGTPIVKYVAQAYRISPDPIDPMVEAAPVAVPGVFCETAATALTPGQTSITAAATMCDLPALPPLDPTDIEYRFGVTAYNTDPTVPTESDLVAGSDDSSLELAQPVVRSVPLRVPDPIISVSGARSALTVPGYISVPMGRIDIDRSQSASVKLSGGILAGTYAVDTNTELAAAGSLPIGFANDDILQVTVRLTSRANGTTAQAYVQVNENLDVAVNSWTVGVG